MWKEKYCIQNPNSTINYPLSHKKSRKSQSLNPFNFSLPSPFSLYISHTPAPRHNINPPSPPIVKSQLMYLLKTKVNMPFPTFPKKKKFKSLKSSSNFLKKTLIVHINISYQTNPHVKQTKTRMIFLSPNLQYLACNPKDQNTPLNIPIPTHEKPKEVFISVLKKHMCC